jgi:hypothetical protein
VSTTTAVAVLLDVTPTAATRLVRVRCPHCSKVHVHGWPYAQTEIGHRVAHCVHGGAGGYTIPTPTGGTR